MTTTTLPQGPDNRFKQLLHDARNGSGEARWLVVQLFRNTMLAIANEKTARDVRRREAPSDIVQETIVEAQRDLDGFRGESEGEMQAWLRHVLSRNISNTERKHRTLIRNIHRERPMADEARNEAVGLVDPSSSPVSKATRREAIDALERVIAGLPADARAVVDLRYRQGRSYIEIARSMNRSEEAVRKLWSRTVARIALEMRGHAR